MDELLAQAPSIRSADPKLVEELKAAIAKDVTNFNAVRKKRKIHRQSMDDLIPHASSARRVDPEVSDSTTTMPKPQPQPPRNSAPTMDAVTIPSAPLSLGSLVDFQDRIILLAARARIAGDGKPDMGRLIIDKICTDVIAQRVVEAYHRQNKSAEQTIEGLKNLYMAN